MQQRDKNKAEPQAVMTGGDSVSVQHSADEWKFHPTQSKHRARLNHLALFTKGSLHSPWYLVLLLVLLLSWSIPCSPSSSNFNYKMKALSVVHQVHIETPSAEAGVGIIGPRLGRFQGS